jgi:hypothetical protein
MTSNRAFSSFLPLLGAFAVLLGGARLSWAEAAPPAGTDVSVGLRVLGIPGGAAAVKSQGVATWFGKEKVEPVPFSLEAGSLSALKLRPGRWILKADAKDYWGAPLQLELTGEPAIVTLDLWPAGTLEGGFAAEPRMKPPSDLRVFFRPGPGTAASQPPPASESSCQVDQASTWRCKVPAGTLDLRFQSGGFVPRYLWGVRIEPGGTVRPGRLELRQGSAVQGWVVTADGTPLGNFATVSLRPRIGGAVRDAGERTRLESLRFEGSVNARGFFQIEGVPPGAYLLEARREGFAPSIVSVRVAPGEVTEVANPPLKLDLPKVVEVFVDPPADPVGQPWSVRLQRLDRDASVVATFAGGVAAGDGAWRQPGVPAGSYLLRVSRNGGETWWSGELKVDESLAPVYVRMDLVTVRGTVRFGKEPLPAKILFGGRFGATRVEAQSNEKGIFEAVLPRAGNWPVYVTSDQPAVEREIPRVKIQPKPGTRVADIALRLPNTVLRGRVIDEKNDPLPNAIVSAMSQGDVIEDPVQARTDDDGHFEIYGLLPGPTLLEADAGEERAVDPVTADVEEGNDAKSWILIAGPRLRIAGTVVSPAGPVPGARIKAAPVGSPYIAVRSVTSDAQGRFEIRLPRKTREMSLSVSAPGFAFRMLRVPVPESRELGINLDQTAGTLVVEKEEELDFADPNAPMIYLLHGGSIEALPQLMGWATAAGAAPAGTKRTIIPSLEPGTYQACLVRPVEWAGLAFGIVPRDRCASGSLAANGELTLKVPGG